MPNVLESAIASHKAGQLDEAALLYQKVLADDELHASALHLLGVLRHQQGDDLRAIELLRKALAVQPNMPVVHANLSDVYRGQGQLDRAIGSCRLALKLWPDCPEALCNLGLALHAIGRSEEAAERLGRALELRPDLAPAHNSLGMILRENGRSDEALDHFRQAVDLDAAFVPALNNLAQVLIGRGKAAEALPHCREAVRLQPGLAVTHYTLGNALEALESPVDARDAYLEALRLDPDMALGHGHLGVTLVGESRPGDALPWLKHAIELDPQNPAFHEWLGALYTEWEEPARAIPCFEQALALGGNERAQLHVSLGQALLDDGRLAPAREQYRVAKRLAPESAQVELQLGNLHEVQGDMAEAEAAFRGALGMRPTAPLPLARLAMNLRGRLPDDDLAAMEHRLSDPELARLPRARLLFALALVLDERGDYGRAAECACEANSISLKRARGWRVHDPVAADAFVDGLITAFSREFHDRASGYGSESRRPIFVFGLPRSGTTLVEQVLSSQSLVYGAGELRLAQRSFESLSALLGAQDPPLENLGGLDRAMVLRLAEQHLDWLAELACGPAERVVDKMPQNYMHLGLLATLFPQAGFVHCRRDLRDVAVSCWMTDFRSIPWANDPEHIAGHFRRYERIMGHWRDVLPVPICEVNYEEIVADLEGVARRLVATCGLEWEEQCLEFHKALRPVRTASVTQVRQPIYRHSVGRWKNYECALADLFAKLPLPEKPLAPVGEAARETSEMEVAMI